MLKSKPSESITVSFLFGAGILCFLCALFTFVLKDNFACIALIGAAIGLFVIGALYSRLDKIVFFLNVLAEDKLKEIEKREQEEKSKQEAAGSEAKSKDKEHDYFN